MIKNEWTRKVENLNAEITLLNEELNLVYTDHNRILKECDYWVNVSSAMRENLFEKEHLLEKYIDENEELKEQIYKLQTEIVDLITK